MPHFSCPSCGAHLAVITEGKKQEIPREAIPSNFGDMLDMVDMTRLDAREKEFIAQTKGRYNQYGEKIRMSPKQLQWIKSIIDRQNSDESF